MNPKRFYYTMVGLNILIICLIGVTIYFGTVFIKSKSTELVQAKTQTKVLDEQQISLRQAKQDIEKYSELNNIAKSIVPQDKDQARTVREINKIAQESGIKLKAISFQASNLGTATPTAKPADGQNATTPAPAAPTVSQVKPVEGLTGVYGLEIIVNSLDTEPVSYANLITFLEKLESNRRTAHVAKIGISPKDDGKSVSFTLTLTAYVKP